MLIRYTVYWQTQILNTSLVFCVNKLDSLLLFNCSNTYNLNLFSTIKTSAYTSICVIICMIREFILLQTAVFTIKEKFVFCYDHPSLSSHDNNSKHIRCKIIIIQCDPNEVHVLKQNGAGV